MSISRRQFVATLVAGTMAQHKYTPSVHATDSTPWHVQIAEHAKSIDQAKPLNMLIPNGSASNVKAATSEFTRLSGVVCNIHEIAIDQINVELILQANMDSIDVALPATFGVIDLAQARVILPLDVFADKYEPAGFTQNHLYRKGDRYNDKLYGYQTDGDAYMLFYNKAMMEDPAEIKAYAKATGKVLKPAKTWEDLDSMMAFFQRPEQNRFGGSLFRNSGYLVWEWWARFHAKGYLPFNDDMQTNVNSKAGVDALEELIAATNSLTPRAESNSLFDNWAEFGNGNVFCNIGWGGTQKYLRSQTDMRDNLIHSALPGPMRDGVASTMGYFNWGWDYTVTTNSTQPELAYLLALFCVSPEISTLAVREPDGFFDPYRESHYIDNDIREVYGDSFLTAHRHSLDTSIPDLYIRGQSNYLDVLRQQIMQAVHGELTAQETMNICAQKWAQITRRLGTSSQRLEWKNLLETYPVNMQNL